MLSKQDEQRAMVLGQVGVGLLGMTEAATLIGVSERQVRRLLAAHQGEGPRGIVHGNRGRPPAHATRAEVRAQVIALATGKLKGRDFKNGQKMYSATRCVVCHRFGGDGGSTGPDLTQLAGRFNLKDLTEAIVDPSKVISDQYKASVIETKDGKVIQGRIVSESKETITVVIDPEIATKVVEVKKSDIETTQPSKVSLMPQKLLSPLNQDEVLDLLAYLLSRGNPSDVMFGK